MTNRKLIGAAAMTAALAGGGLLGATLGIPAISGAQDGTTTTAPAANGGSPAPDADQGRHGPHGFRGGPELDVAAKALGITADELRTELQSGKSIAEVAKAEGVDKQKVIDALVAAGEKRLDEAKASLPDRVAAMVDGKMPAGGPDRGGFGGRGGPGFGKNLDAAAKALGVTADELRTELQSGKSLADVAKAEGVDTQKVIDALVADAKARLADAVKSGRITQAQADERSADLVAHITEEVNEVHTGHPGGPGRHGPSGGRPDAPADSTTNPGGA